MGKRGPATTDEQLRRWYEDDHLSSTEIASRLGISAHTAWRRLRAAGVQMRARGRQPGKPGKPYKTHPKISRAQLLAWATAGTTRAAAAAETGLTEGGIYSTERRYGIWLYPLPEDVARQVAAAMRAAGLSNYLIMSVLRRSEMTVSRYLRPATWERGARRRAPGYAAVTELAGSDLTDEQIAEQTGLALPTVGQYRRYALGRAAPLTRKPAR